MILRSAAPTALVLLALAGCSSSGPTSATSTDAVGALVVADVPAGFTPRPEAASHTGPTDLTKAVRDDGQADARAALTAARFVHGYQRLWTNGAGDVVAVQVYEFADARGAAAYERRTRAVAQHQAEHVTAFAVPGVTTAHGSELDVEGNATEQVSAARGSYVVQVLCTSRTMSGLRARAQQLAVAQYRRLAQSR